MHGRMSDEAIDEIDWDLVGETMQLLPPGCWCWVTKHTSGNRAFGVTMVKWGMQIDDTCPVCDSDPETVQHVYQCSHESVKTCWNSVFNNLNHWLIQKLAMPQL